MGGLHPQPQLCPGDQDEAEEATEDDAETNSQAISRVNPLEGCCVGGGDHEAALAHRQEMRAQEKQRAMEASEVSLLEKNFTVMRGNNQLTLAPQDSHLVSAVLKDDEENDCDRESRGSEDSLAASDDSMGVRGDSSMDLDQFLDEVVQPSPTSSHPNSNSNFKGHLRVRKNKSVDIKEQAHRARFHRRQAYRNQAAMDLQTSANSVPNRLFTTPLETQNSQNAAGPKASNAFDMTPLRVALPLTNAAGAKVVYSHEIRTQGDVLEFEQACDNSSNPGSQHSIASGGSAIGDVSKWLDPSGTLKAPSLPSSVIAPGVRLLALQSDFDCWNCVYFGRLSFDEVEDFPWKYAPHDGGSQGGDAPPEPPPQDKPPPPNDNPPPQDTNPPADQGVNPPAGGDQGGGNPPGGGGGGNGGNPPGGGGGGDGDPPGEGSKRETTLSFHASDSNSLRRRKRRARGSVEVEQDTRVGRALLQVYSDGGKRDLYEYDGPQGYGLYNKEGELVVSMGEAPTSRIGISMRRVALKEIVAGSVAIKPLPDPNHPMSPRSAQKAQPDNNNENNNNNRLSPTVLNP